MLKKRGNCDDEAMYDVLIKQRNIVEIMLTSFLHTFAGIFKPATVHQSLTTRPEPLKVSDEALLRKNNTMKMIATTDIDFSCMHVVSKHLYPLCCQ